MGRLRCGQWAWSHRHHLLYSAACQLAAATNPLGHPFPGKDHPESRHQLFHASGSHHASSPPAHRTARTQAFRRHSPLRFQQSRSARHLLPPASPAPAPGMHRLTTSARPRGTGVVQVTASALGATSPPTLVFVHPPIDNIQISVVPPVNSPPPPAPPRPLFPLACKLEFNGNCRQLLPFAKPVANFAGHRLTARASISPLRSDPFTWTQANSSVVTITPIVTIIHQRRHQPGDRGRPSTPGQTQVIASASGVSSQPYNF